LHPDRIRAAGSSHRVGYMLLKNGYSEEAEKYFEKQLEYCYRTIELGRPYAHRDLYAYYDLAAVYAFRGDREKAYENLSLSRSSVMWRPNIRLRTIGYSNGWRRMICCKQILFQIHHQYTPCRDIDLG